MKSSFPGYKVSVTHPAPPGHAQRIPSKVISPLNPSINSGGLGFWLGLTTPSTTVIRLGDPTVASQESSHNMKIHI